MKKQFTALFALTISVAAYSQVGINTEAPKTTMDVSAKRDTSGTITDNTQLVGLQAPRLNRAEITANTATYGTQQKGALVYITDVSGGDTLGQRVNITAVGYYYFDGSLWQKLSGNSIANNIYNSDDTFTGNRTATIPSGQWLLFETSGNTAPNTGSSVGIGDIDSNDIAKLNVKGFIQFGPDDNDYGVGRVFNDAIGEKYGLTQSGYYPNGGSAHSPGTRIYTSGRSGVLGHISFGKYTDPSTYTEFGRFSQGAGNFGIGTITITNTSASNAPTERLDVEDGTARIRMLPLNGATNAINTKPDGTPASSTTNQQDQTFTATRTVVADANGVLGYVAGLPSTGSGTPPTGSINVGQTVSVAYSVPIATATVAGWRLGSYVTANSLTALPVLDGIQMDLLGYDSSYYTPIIENTASASQLISYQTFATQVNENRTNLNQTLSPCPFGATTFSANLWDGNNSAGWRGVDANNIVYWSTSAAEVETTNLQVQIDANTYRWYEFKWWCMEVSGQKKIFLSVTRKA